MISVLLVEDQIAVREAFKTMIDLQDDMEVVACAASAREAVNLAWVHQPDVALVDVQIVEGDGFSVVEQLRSSVKNCRCIMLTAFDMPGYVNRAYERGAWAFLTKTIPFTQIIEAIKQVNAGKHLLSHQEIPDSTHSVLSNRETEVLQAAAHMGTTAEIAEELHLSQGTVNNYISCILAKLGAGNRAQAVRIAENNGWL